MHSIPRLRVHRRALAAPIAIVALAGLIAAGCARKSSEPATTSLQLEPVGYAGANPFSPPVGSDRPDVVPPPNAGGTYAGNTAGLYGGTENVSTCNPQAMVTFLQQHPDKAAAWAGVLGIAPAGIPAYVSGLTSVVLRSDTAVTNHGFDNGHATTIASVLQAGTAVLVDANGFPVTKCFCGNPLTAPTAYQKVTFVGTSWASFSATTITFIQATVTVITQFILVEPVTGASFNRPVGTDGSADVPATPATANPPGNTPPTGPGATTPPPGATTQGPTTPATTPGATTPATTPSTVTPGTSTPGATTSAASPATSSPGPAAQGAPVTASWVIGGCFVDRTGTPTMRGTVLVRNNDPTVAHSYQVTVEFGPSGSYGQTTLAVAGVAPGQTQTTDVSTPAIGNVPGGSAPACQITTIVDESGKAPSRGPALPAPPAVAPQPTTPSTTPSTVTPSTARPSTARPSTVAPSTAPSTREPTTPPTTARTTPPTTQPPVTPDLPSAVPS